MTIVVNGKAVEAATGETVAGLLVKLSLAGTPCAVEVNETLVPKARHGERVLGEGDSVEIVTLVGGG